VPELIISPAARRDLMDQAAYYREQGTSVTADRWLVKTRKAFELVAAHPGMGELSTDTTSRRPRATRVPIAYPSKTFPRSQFPKPAPSPYNLEVCKNPDGKVCI